MLNKSTQSPLHKKWHKRVEGQIRDAVHSHPEWFRGDIERMTNSLAKRIVGEIIAESMLADNTELADAQLTNPGNPDSVLKVEKEACDVRTNCSHAIERGLYGGFGGRNESNTRND